MLAPKGHAGMGARFWLGLAASLAVIGAAAGITLGVLTLAGVTFEGEQAEGQGARPPGATICVQAIGVDAAVEPTAVNDIEAALVDVAKHQYWSRAWTGAAPPNVDIGCPSEPFVGRSGVIWKDGIPLGPIGGEGAVAQKSYYALFVYVMPVSEIERLLGGLSRRWAPQEFTCEGDLCFQVTAALYLSPADMADRDSLVSRLLEGLGLEKPPLE